MGQYLAPLRAECISKISRISIKTARLRFFCIFKRFHEASTVLIIGQRLQAHQICMRIIRYRTLPEL